MTVRQNRLMVSNYGGRGDSPEWGIYWRREK